jgi:hypothetical protein
VDPIILSQPVDADELEGLSHEELREMILKLDQEVNYGSSDVLHLHPDTPPDRTEKEAEIPGLTGAPERGAEAAPEKAGI